MKPRISDAIINGRGSINFTNMNSVFYTGNYIEYL